jgi:acylphosphatase
MKARIKIIGRRVHEVGYRSFLFSQAFNLGIKRFEAYNDFVEGKPAVICLVEAEEGKVKRFSDLAKKNMPKDAEVEWVREEPYEGEVSEIYAYASALNVEQLSKGVDVLFEIRDHTKVIPEIKVDTSAIRSDISELEV